MLRKNVLRNLHKKASGEGSTQEIHIFDFDSCLFRSPYPPAGWKGGWWGSLVSLDQPCVPFEPDSSWWNSEVVSKAKESIANPNVYTMLMTGRQDHVFRYRIIELLNQVGLNFDFIGLNDQADTFGYKLSQMKNKLMEFSKNEALTISAVRIWDDNGPFLGRYKSHLQKFCSQIPSLSGIEVEVNHVVALSKEANCPSLSFDSSAIWKKGSYLALFLDSRSQASLFYHFPQRYEKPYGEHVTLVYQPNREMLNEVKDFIGKEYLIKVIGEAFRDGIQCVLVSISGLEPIFQNNQILHITISSEIGVPPKKSNEIISKGWGEVDGPVLSGFLLYK